LIKTKYIITISISYLTIFNPWLSSRAYPNNNQTDNQYLIKQANLVYLNAGGKKVYPVDEASQNANFLKFRQQFQAALQRKDLNFLLQHLDNNIKLSFGGHQGKRDFIQLWKLDKNPEKSEVWRTLLELLPLGGKFQDQTRTSFIAPYTFLAEVDDPYNQCIITGQDVSVRSGTSSQSNRLGLLSYDLVKCFYQSNPRKETINGETYPWIAIETTEKIKGYVYGKYIRSPIDYRVNFVRQNGVWKMSFFVAGD
jgi:hypothetical protein